MELQLLPLNEIDESSSNPRQTFNEDSLKELAADLTAHGVLQPVQVRAQGERFELVFGHRRFRAAKLAGLGFIPATVTTLSDTEVLETQLSENGSREDLHPLDYAHALRRLHKEHGVSVEDIAERLGKSKGTVYNAIKLCTLEAPAVELFRDGKLNPSTALLVAQIKDPEKQERAAKKIAEGHGKDGPLSYREALDVLPRDSGVEQKSDRDTADAAAEREERAIAKRKAARAVAITDKAVAEMVAKVQVLEENRKFWALLASAVDGENAPETLRRRLGPQSDPELALEEEARFLASLPKMDAGQLRGFVFEAVMEAKFHPALTGPTAELKAAADFFKVDLKELTAEVKADERAAAKAKEER